MKQGAYDRGNAQVQFFQGNFGYTESVVNEVLSGIFPGRPVMRQGHFVRPSKFRDLFFPDKRLAEPEQFTVDCGNTVIPVL
jgi:hypothetical protein